MRQVDGLGFTDGLSGALAISGSFSDTLNLVSFTHLTVPTNREVLIQVVDVII